MLETNRLILRAPMIGDARPLNEAINRSLEVFTRWMPWAKDPSLKTTEAFIEKSVAEAGNPTRREIPFIMILKENQMIIGATGFNEMSDPLVPYFEIGYWIDTQCSGQGLTTEAIIALTQYAFTELNAQRVQICCQAENIASVRVAEKSGFRLEARLHNQYRDLKTGEVCDRLVFARFGI